MLFGDIMDQLLDQYGLADTGTTEQTDLTALCIRTKQVDDLDACFQHFRACLLFVKSRCSTMNRHSRRVCYFT